jgi:O-antigen/teichoic acid export membrane protein
MSVPTNQRPPSLVLNALPDGLSLKRRILGAGAWSLAGFALSNAIRLGSSLLMTRLLVPEMFGLMAIAMMVLTGLAMFSDVGLRPSIIQNTRGNDPVFLNTAWAIQIIRALLLWLLALCISLLILVANRLGLVSERSVYSDPELPYVVAVVSISALIGGFQSTKLYEASRHLVLGRVTQMQIVAQIAGLICMFGWALVDRSIWALVAGGIFSSVMMTLFSHVWLPGVGNRWHWDHSSFYEILNFGKWIFLSSILGFLGNNADRILLGGFVDGTTLGIYSIAFAIYNSIVQIMNKLFADVSFSAFSEVARERPTDLKRVYYQFHVVTASFTYFCMGFLIVSGATLISLLYDHRYQHAGWMLEVLAVALLVVPFHLTMNCFLALGFPKSFSYLIGIRVAAMFVLVPLGFHFLGVPGALWGNVAGQLLSLPAIIYYQLKYKIFDLSTELTLLPTLFAGMLIAKGLKLAFGQ